MRNVAITLAAGGVVLGVGLAACSGPEALVGINEAEQSNAGATGADGHEGGASVTFFRGQVRGSGPKCMPRPLVVEPGGAVPCRMYAVPSAPSPASCACDAPTRGPVEAGARGTVVDYLRENLICWDDGQPEFGNQACADVCVCEVFQAAGADLASCQNELVPSSEGGWCYVDLAQGVGSGALVAECGETEQRAIHVYGDAVPGEEPFELKVVVCTIPRVVPSHAPVLSAPLGAPCVPGDEYSAHFSSYSLEEVTIETESPACDSGLCVVNHMQGRASCPYGQKFTEATTSPACFVPASDLAVTVPVSPQWVERQSRETAVCSCRCDGPGGGPFCACPDEMVCAPLVLPFGLPTDDAFVGSYCVPVGTTFDARQFPVEECLAHELNCGDPRPY
jgi:hypothetical protein